MTDEEEEGVGTIWVYTEPDLEGKDYIVTVALDEDTSFALNRQEVHEYVDEIVKAANYAEYDAAVFKQVEDIVRTAEADEDPMQMIGKVIVELRGDRQPVDFDRWLISLDPSVNGKGKPFLLISVRGKQVGQWPPDLAREHAYGVLDALMTAPLDQSYAKILQSTFKVEPQIARNVVQGLQEHR